MIQIVGLTTGEQLIAKVEEQENGLLLKKPAILVPTGNKGELGLAPWIPYADSENGISVLWSGVAWHVNAKTDLANHYNGAFVNGLVVPQPQEVAAPDLKLVES